MASKLPNFLIVGAAKSGTTSLYYYLKQHPEIYMSPVKEPNFLSGQFIKYPFVKKGDERIATKAMTFEDYKKLFKNVKSEKAIGEASPDSLPFYEDAIRNIKKYLGEVKIIIILRNPVDKVFSTYSHWLREQYESLSFEDALKSEKERVHDWWGYAYQLGGFYYNKVKAYKDNFSQVRVYLYDDLRQNPLGLIKDIYEFLGVDPSFIPDLETRYNISGLTKSRFLHNLLTKPNILKTVGKLILRPFISKHKRKAWAEGLKAKNLVKIKMRPETREYLKNLYREDILKLQDLINKNLSHWLS